MYRLHFAVVGLGDARQLIWMGWTIKLEGKLPSKPWELVGRNGLRHGPKKGVYQLLIQVPGGSLQGQRSHLLLKCLPHSHHSPCSMEDLFCCVTLDKSLNLTSLLPLLKNGAWTTSPLRSPFSSRALGSSHMVQSWDYGRWGEDPATVWQTLISRAEATSLAWAGSDFRAGSRHQP